MAAKKWLPPGNHPYSNLTTVAISGTPLIIGDLAHSGKGLKGTVPWAGKVFVKYF